MRQARRRQRASRELGEKLLAKEACQAYGEWFESLPWDWFATFTLPEGSTREYLLTRHEDWTRRIQAESGHDLRQALGIELQRNGTPHAHALIAGLRQTADPDHAS